MITAREAIDAWARWRDNKRVVAWQPDGNSIPMGSDGKPDPNYYGYMRVEEALSALCKLRSQRETLIQLLNHHFVKGLPVRSFNGANFGWDHETVLQNTIDALLSQIETTIKATPVAEIPKAVEMA